MHPLSTKRLALRPPRPTDRAFIADLQSNPKVRKFLGGPQSQLDADQTALAIVTTPHDTLWLVETTIDATPCAMVSLSPHKDGADTEVSYQFHPSVWGNGYATEALTVLLRYARKDLGLPRVIAETQTANTASTRLLQRVGMTQIRTVQRFGQPQSIFAT